MCEQIVLGQRGSPPPAPPGADPRPAPPRPCHARGAFPAAVGIPGAQLGPPPIPATTRLPSPARAGPVGSVLLTVPSNRSCCFIGRLEAQGGRPCPRSPSFQGAEGRFREPRWMFPRLPALQAGSPRGAGQPAAKGGAGRKWGSSHHSNPT